MSRSQSVVHFDNLPVSKIVGVAVGDLVPCRDKPATNMGMTDAEVQKYKEDYKDADFDPKLHLRLDRPNPPSEDEKYVENWTFNIYYIRNDKLGINKFLREPSSRTPTLTMYLVEHDSMGGITESWVHSKRVGHLLNFLDILVSIRHAPNLQLLPADIPCMRIPRALTVNTPKHIFDESVWKIWSEQANASSSPEPDGNDPAFELQDQWQRISQLNFLHWPNRSILPSQSKRS